MAFPRRASGTLRSGTWDTFTHAAIFLGDLANKWLQDPYNERDQTRKNAVEQEIQSHLDRISLLLVEQDSIDSDSTNLDLAVEEQLIRIHELLDEEEVASRMLVSFFRMKERLI